MRTGNLRPARVIRDIVTGQGKENAVTFVLIRLEQALRRTQGRHRRARGYYYKPRIDYLHVVQFTRERQMQTTCRNTGRGSSRSSTTAEWGSLSTRRPHGSVGNRVPWTDSGDI